MSVMRLVYLEVIIISLCIVLGAFLKALLAGTFLMIPGVAIPAIVAIMYLVQLVFKLANYETLCVKG